MGADQPPALLAEPSGIVLWLWFEVAVGLSVVVVVLSALILGLDVDGAPLIPVVVALILGVGCLMLAHQARSYRRTAGWVDVDDDGWDELRREAQSERDLRGWEELAPPPTAADVAAARHESFSAHASRLCAVAALTVLAWAGLVGCLIAGAILCKEWSTEFILWCACVAALSISVSTLPLFARAHSCAAANGESSALRFALALSQPPWQLCAGATRAARATAAFFRSVDARLPCCHHVRKAHKAARAPKGPPKGAESPRKKNAEATAEETDDQFAAPDEFPEA
jgi:hypothetical protein